MLKATAGGIGGEGWGRGSVFLAVEEPLSKLCLASMTVVKRERQIKTTKLRGGGLSNLHEHTSFNNPQLLKCFFIILSKAYPSVSHNLHVSVSIV